jgi:HEAT repeat protein
MALLFALRGADPLPEPEILPARPAVPRSPAAERPEPGERMRPALVAPDALSLDEAIDRALDPDVSFELRVQAIRLLAGQASDEAIDVLERVLRSDAPPMLKAAIASALGRSEHPDARRIVEQLLSSDEPAVVRGAIRGLVELGVPDLVERLTGFLFDEGLPDSVRGQAALSLGEVGGTAAQQALRAAFAEVVAEGVRGSILDGMGQLPFSQTADFFRAVLENAGLSNELKLEALEALAKSTPDAGSLLLDYARHATDPEMREAAVESAAWLDEFEGTSALLAQLADEPSPEVRSSIYNALAFEAGATYAEADMQELLPQILSESTPRERLEGFRLVAGMLRGAEDAALVESFDREMAPWLHAEAEGAADRYIRLVSIDALKMAATPASIQALGDLRRSTDPEVARAAERALDSLERMGAASRP